MTPALEKEGPVASTSSRSVQGQPQRTSEEAERSQKQSRQIQLAQTLLMRVQDPQIGAFSSGQCIQYGQKPYGIHRKQEGKDEKDLSTQIIHEMKPIKSSIDVQLGNVDAKFNKLISDINDLKKNERAFAEWHKVKKAKLE
ncbi:hypothetical protein O181_055406 [Austropuccinia psidii MF-1]|uniref:Uncharacterized protein n=1 Tax=Austropuccinia psidii MF-1 TaxID=1389203 RepID=A0A9Q3EBA8_9BASI|nr:hypothetical protein [Austropuccinia psidii MF-1]